MKKSNQELIKIQYESTIKHYGFHKYVAKRLSCKLTIVCKSIEELVIAQVLGGERKWMRTKYYYLYVVMPNYRRYV